MTEGLKDLPGLNTPYVQDGCTHAYYVYPLTLSPETIGVSRKKIIQALNAEGVPGLFEGYTLLHMLPLYQKRIAFGQNHYPWISPFYQGGCFIQQRHLSCSRAITGKNLHWIFKYNVFYKP